MPWTDGGTPVTIDTLFGLVKVGTMQSAQAQNPFSRARSKNGARPASIAAPVDVERCLRAHRVTADGAPLATPISPSTVSTAASAPRISASPSRPMQPMRKLSATVSLPG